LAFPLTAIGASSFKSKEQCFAVSSPISVPTPATLVLDSSRAAMLQGSPIRENANLSVAPKFPAIQMPELTPIPIAISGMPSSLNFLFSSMIFPSLSLG
jgi:hypothetical protein